MVYFNRLVDEVPTFSIDSGGTPSPINQGQTVDINGILPDFSALKEQLIRENPLMDAVRRWVAPYDGEVHISGTVNLIKDESKEREEYAPDGVRGCDPA